MLYCDAVANEILERELGARKVRFEELTSQADFISIHVPLLPDTHHLFNAGVFDRMKSTACHPWSKKCSTRRWRISSLTW